MPIVPTPEDLLKRIQALEAELREQRKLKVPGQLTGHTETGRPYWAFTDDNSEPLVANDAGTGYGLARPHLIYTFYKSRPEDRVAFYDHEFFPNNEWQQGFVGYIPGVAPFMALGLLIQITDGYGCKFEVETYNANVLYQSPEYWGPFDQYVEVDAIPMSHIGYDEVHWMQINVMKLTVLAEDPPLEDAQGVAIQFAGAWGQRS